MNNTVAIVNREIEKASLQQQKEFLFYLLGWLETAERQGTIHPNTVTGVEYAAKTTIRRRQPQEAA